MHLPLKIRYKHFNIHNVHLEFITNENRLYVYYKKNLGQSLHFENGLANTQNLFGLYCRHSRVPATFIDVHINGMCLTLVSYYYLASGNHYSVRQSCYNHFETRKLFRYNIINFFFKFFFFFFMQEHEKLTTTPKKSSSKMRLQENLEQKKSEK